MVLTPQDDVGRLNGIGRILPDDEWTERTSARSGDGSDISKSGPSGWHADRVVVVVVIGGWRKGS